MMTKTKRGEKGFVLFMLFAFMATVMLMIGSYLFVIMGHLKLAYRTANLTKAYYVADAGLADAFMKLRAYAAPPFSFTASNGNYAVSPNATGSYSVQVASDGSPWPVYTMTSRGSYGGLTKTLVLKVRMISFSRWGYLSNTEIDPYWGGNWFITGMISTGPTHTNGQFNMWGAPVFAGTVSQVNPAIHYWVGPPTDNPNFQKGVTVNAPTLELPAASAFLNSINTGAQQPGGLVLTGNSNITFVNNGTMNVTNAKKKWVNYNIPVPSNGALYVQSGTATIQGILKGKLTVASDTDVYIGGNLVYNTNPRTDSSSADMLGIVAKNNVYVTQNGPYNIEVDGAIVALTGQFQVQNFWTFLKGDMVQYGGLTTKLPGGLTGIFNPYNGQMIAGYNQLQYFDERFYQYAPPWFPPVMDSGGRITYSKVSFSEL